MHVLYFVSLAHFTQHTCKFMNLDLTGKLELHHPNEPDVFVYFLDKIIRHRACTLRDTAYAYIKAEMDTDFEEKCRGIRDTRLSRFECVSKPSVPNFIHVAPIRVRILSYLAFLSVRKLLCRCDKM